MVDICEELQEIKSCFAKQAHDYAVAATYGRATQEDLFKLSRMATIVKTLEDNTPEYKKVRLHTDNLQGKYVSMSVLTKKNNTLFLNVSEKTICTTVAVRPCLTDSEICDLVDQAKTLCYYCN